MKALVKHYLYGLFIVLYTVTVYCFFAVILIVIALPLAILLIVAPNNKRFERLIFWLLDLLYKAIIAALMVKVVGAHHNQLPDSPVIMVANHQSALDIMLLGSLCNGYPHIWYALSYYADVPVFGFFIKKLGVPVDRSSNNRAAFSLIKLIKRVASSSKNIIIFPEGGRFNDGTVHPFLRGFVVIAKKTGRPVVPIFMPYNGALYPPRSFFIYHRSLHIEIGPLFVYKSDDTDDSFCDRVYDWFDSINKKF